MKTLRDVKPGDTVLLTGIYHYHDPKVVEVDRVGRKYIHLRDHRGGGFRIEGGHEATDPSHRRIRTRDEYQRDRERTTLIEEIGRVTGRRITSEPFISRLTNDRLREFLAFVLYDQQEN